MKNIFQILLLSNLAHAIDTQIDELPIGLTEEEKTRIHEIYTQGRETDPPSGPIRNIAEYERMEGVLIRYPFGISISLISEMSEDVTIYCLVSPNSQNNAHSAMDNGGVNMENVQYVLGQTDSYWTRDYGPWWVVDGDRNVSIVDHTYNRPRPNDNQAPVKMSNHLNVPYFASDIIHAGGNYMTDGLGISASSSLVYDENNMSSTQVNQLMEDYYGIQTYHVVDDPNNTYIDHIDCWGKYLSATKVLIREVPAEHAQYNLIQSTASYFANTLNNWGEPWQVYRVWTPNNQPYTNSTILNDKILVPITGSSWDEEALEIYEEAMPGYEIIPFTGTWESTDALHCRTKGIPDLEMLQVFHNPVDDGTEPDSGGYVITAQVDDLSEAGIVEDSMKIFWRVLGDIEWHDSPVYNTNQELNNWSGQIPPLTTEAMIQYFIQTADSSGRVENSPLAGWHEFLALPTDICLEWDLGDIDNSTELDVFDILILADYISSETAMDICSRSVSDINNDNSISILDLILLINLVMNS